MEVKSVHWEDKERGIGEKTTIIAGLMESEIIIKALKYYTDKRKLDYEERAHVVHIVEQISHERRRAFEECEQERRNQKRQ